MANESKIETIGNFFVVSDITTRVRYISEASEDVVYNRDENDVFTFFKRGSFNTSTQGKESSTLGLPNKSAFEFSECVDKDGAAFSSADDLEIYLSTVIGGNPILQGNFEERWDSITAPIGGTWVAVTVPSSPVDRRVGVNVESNANNRVIGVREVGV